jgi:hypothetical protein
MPSRIGFSLPSFDLFQCTAPAANAHTGLPAFVAAFNEEVESRATYEA